MKIKYPDNLYRKIFGDNVAIPENCEDIVNHVFEKLLKDRNNSDVATDSVKVLTLHFKEGKDFVSIASETDGFWSKERVWQICNRAIHILRHPTYNRMLLGLPEISNSDNQESEVFFNTFSVRTSNCLRRGKIDSFEKLTSMTIDDLYNIRNISRRCIDEIQIVLESLGLGLANSVE